MDSNVFANGLSMAYDNSSSDQCLLGRAVTNLCLFNHQQILQHPALGTIVNRYEASAWNSACLVGDGYVQNMKRALTDLVADCLDHGGRCDQCEIIENEVGNVRVECEGPLCYHVDDGC